MENNEYIYPENPLYKLSQTTIKVLTESVKRVAETVNAIAKSGTFQNMINACYKPFLTPRQYHLM